MLKKLSKFILNEKRVLKLLGIEQPIVNEHKQFILSCDPLISISNLEFSENPVQLRFKIIKCKSVEIQVLFDVLMHENQINAQVQTIPQHFEQTENADFEVVCKNSFLHIRNCYILVTGIGQIGDNEVQFQMFEADLNKTEILKEVVKVHGEFYELQKVYGATTPGDENKTSCCICFDENPKIVAMPCRHLILCKECAEKFRIRSQECPLCRAQIEVLIDLE
uniref:Zinc finger and RING finger domain-containing protein n=1 Tax=Trepomonas sp. PC1 TaxID=1076344 RepID=A0A146KM43_9EUKA|eukprot:JAP96401.1 Zinc finger and RING finger domain-containing protein [Trepomonas sp. PC1]